MATLTRTTNHHTKDSPAGNGARPVTQQADKEVTFPGQFRLPAALAFLVPAELPFQRSKTLSYRDKMELKWFLTRHF
jgi:hypothetical protein